MILSVYKSSFLFVLNYFLIALEKRGFLLLKNMRTGKTKSYSAVTGSFEAKQNQNIRLR